MLRSPLAQAFDVLPTTAKKKDESWKHDNVVPLGPMGTFTLATTFTYRGPSAGDEEIATTADISFQAKKGDAGDLGFRILKLDLSKKQGTGRVIFDNVRGRLKSRVLELPLEGKMELEVMGTKMDVQLKGTETRTIELHDKRPK